MIILVDDFRGELHLLKLIDDYILSAKKDKARTMAFEAVFTSYLGGCIN